MTHCSSCTDSVHCNTAVRRYWCRPFDRSLHAAMATARCIDALRSHQCTPYRAGVQIQWTEEEIVGNRGLAVHSVHHSEYSPLAVGRAQTRQAVGVLKRNPNLLIRRGLFGKFVKFVDNCGQCTHRLDQTRSRLAVKTTEQAQRHGKTNLIIIACLGCHHLEKPMLNTVLKSKRERERGGGGGRDRKREKQRERNK